MWWFWWAIAIAAAVLVAGALLVYTLGQGWKWLVVRGFQRAWGRGGKDLLLVYSDSPHWREYIERTWIPKWGHRAVLLNWSERSRWQSRWPEVRLFHAFAGAQEFNPLGIVVPPTGRRVLVVRFWRAFRDHKHGNSIPLRKMEGELERALGMGPMEQAND